MSDVSKVLLFTKDKTYTGTLNGLHKEMSQDPNYKFLEVFELNEELLQYYASLQDKLQLYIFTSETIQDAPEIAAQIQAVFKEIFSASKLNIIKKDKTAYQLLLTKINLSPEEVVFIDDSQDNIAAAQEAGLQTVLFTDNESAIGQVNSLISQQ